MTGPGIEEISAENLPMNPHTTERTAAPPMTHTLYTFVIAMTPMFSP